MFIAAILLLSATMGWAAAAKVQPFIFTLHALSAVVTDSPNPALKGIPLVTITGIDPKTLYLLYPPVKRIGFLQTDAFIQRWKQWGNKKRSPLLVIFKANGHTVLTGLVPGKKIGFNSWTFYAVKPGDQVFAKLGKKPVRLSGGVYTRVVISSDALSIDMQTLPHSICAAAMKMTQCKMLPIH